MKDDWILVLQVIIKYRFRPLVQEGFLSQSLAISFFYLGFEGYAGDYEERFGKFSLTNGEQKGIPIGYDDTKELRLKGTKCLVGQLGVQKKVNKEAFKTLLTRIWKLVGRIVFKEIRENLWLFEFSEEGDRNRS
jgi:hypothetical protein